MDSTTVINIIIVVICVILSAYFSGTETAFSSLNKARLKSHVKNEVKGAKKTYELSERFDEILSTILIGNNIVNIVAASLATIIVSDILHVKNSQAVTISTIIMTITVLIFGEITPKTIAKEKAEETAIFSTPILRLFMVILKPLNYPFSGLKLLLSKIFKFDNEKGISDEELINIVEEAEQDGELDEHESKLIKSAIEFDDCEALDILTSRLDVVAIPKSLTMEEVKNTFLEHGFSRMPVYDENIDQVIGVINEKDFYQIYFENKPDFLSIIKPIYCTVPKTKISDLLRELQTNKSHICLVVDEFGTSIGIITIEDILEELVGEIWDEHDEVILDFTKVSDNTYKVLCSANLEEFLENFNKKYDEEKYEDIQTVSGWVIEQIGNIPALNDSFTYEDLTITVTKTDYKRILEIEVIVNPHYIFSTNED